MLNVDAVTAAILGLSVLLVTGVVTWKECLAESVAWDTLTWFAALIAMAGYLNKYGLISWFSQTVVKVCLLSSYWHLIALSLFSIMCRWFAHIKVLKLWVLVVGCHDWDIYIYHWHYFLKCLRLISETFISPFLFLWLMVNTWFDFESSKWYYKSFNIGFNELHDFIYS